MTSSSLALQPSLAVDLGGDPLPLPDCAYPRAADTRRHGVQPLPARLPRVSFASALAYRSRHYRTVPLSELRPAQVLETAAVVGASFAEREPQCRHLRPPRAPDPALTAARHTDPFGTAGFGPWSTAHLLTWFIRLLVLTDPTSPLGRIRRNDAALEQSLAIVDENERILGGAINETLSPHGDPSQFRKGDPLLDAVLGFTAPVLELLGAQDAEGVAALERYPGFAAAYTSGRVGHHFMVARSDALSKLDAFELVAGTAERYRELGFSFVIVEATNQWTGAACEALRGVRVHFAPFRARRWVPASPAPLASTVSSPDGYLAAKDSGSMLYVLRLR